MTGLNDRQVPRVVAASDAVPLSARDRAQPKGGVIVAAARPAAVPTERARIAAEPTRALDLGFVARARPLGVRRDIEGVGRTVDFAQKAGLAVGLPRDCRRGLRQRVEYIGRAHPAQISHAMQRVCETISIII